MSRRLALITVVLCLPGLTAEQTFFGSTPLSEVRLTELVKASVPAPQIEGLVKSCGIDFEPTGEVMGRLRSAGMPEAVLDAVRGATGPAERKRQEEHP